MSLQTQEGLFYRNMSIVKQIQITKDGLISLQEELDKLVNDKRPKMVKRLSSARAAGDLSENSDYQNAKDELEFLDGRISELDDVLKNSVVVKSSSNNGKVAVGTKVKLRVNGSEHEYHIVGEWEADPANKKISHESPLGRALCDKKVGDKVEVEAPAGVVTYKILSIK